MKKNLLLIVLSTVLFLGMTTSNAFAFSVNGNDESPMMVSSNSGDCMSGTFIAREDGHIVGTITLNSNCTFKIVERSGYDVTTTSGTYSIDGRLTKGQMTSITFYVNGESMGSATLAWPEEQGICIFMNGYVFAKE